MTIGPGPVYAISDANGEFIAGLPQGSYTLAQPLAEEAQLCPVAHPVPFTLNATTPDVTIDLADSSLVPHDLAVGLWTSNARPGFPTSTYVILTNTSAYPSGVVTLTLTFPGILQSPIPASGQWTFPSVPPYSNGVHTFSALVPADIALLGIPLDYMAMATNCLSEVNTVNNSASTTVVVTGSYDPNDKIGRTSSGFSDDLYFADFDAWIDYTVRFQNTGTAAAETVVLRDLIDANLSIPSIEILGASHGFTPSFSATEPRELVLTFADINLPDSTTDLLGSQGFFSYRIKPISDVAIGAVIENTANIYFDFNPAIVTNTTQHVVSVTVGITEFEMGTLCLSPNPASDVLNVIMTTGTSLFELLTIDGRRVPVTGTYRSDGFQLDVRALPAGLYYVRTEAGSARFVKH